jgi:hypothetical protein
MTASSIHSADPAPAEVTLTPDYCLPVAIALLALPLYFVSLWALVVVELFAVFLSVQTATLRLVFTHNSLNVFLQQTEIRHFPYSDWHHWEIFWSPVPILFYFREVNSIHFLPIIFNPAQLRQQLETRLPLASLPEHAPQSSP